MASARQNISRVFINFPSPHRPPPAIRTSPTLRPYPVIPRPAPCPPRHLHRQCCYLQRAYLSLSPGHTGHSPTPTVSSSSPPPIMHPFGGTPKCPKCDKPVYAAEQVRLTLPLWATACSLRLLLDHGPRTQGTITASLLLPLSHSFLFSCTIRHVRNHASVHLLYLTPGLVLPPVQLV